MMEPAALTSVVRGLQGGSAFGAGLQSWAESAASILISGLWQGVVVACGLAVCMRLTPRIPARLRYGIWAAGFGALVCLPVLAGLVERLTAGGFGAAAGDSMGFASGSQSHPLVSLDARWSVAIAGLWVAASLLRGVGLTVHAVRMRRLWSSARPLGAANCGDLEQSVGARRAATAELCVTNELDRPCVIGFFSPRILIPAWLLNRLAPAELEQVVLHEAEHLRRMDDWANLLQKLCLVVFPLNPALWWLERRLCAEREMACDDGVVGRTQAPRAYAACLAGLAEKGLARRDAALSLGAWQRRPELAERVHRLLRRPCVLSPAASVASVALVGCGLVAGTVGLARCPELVAFVSPASNVSNGLSASAHMAVAEPGLGDIQADVDLVHGSGGFAGSGPQAYRAVKTMAIVPARRPTSLPRGIDASPRTDAASEADRGRESNNSSLTGHSLASLVPTAVAAQMRAQQVSRPTATQNAQTGGIETSARLSGSHGAGEEQTGWIVLTTFEEVQTSGSGGDVQGDAVVSEAGVNSGAESRGANNATGAKTSARISVTRLVLRFVQPMSNAEPGANAKPGSDAQPGSNSAQPIAIPYRDGWFVIQL
jgi:beta-lactamase regulating signal transducer with metallopeptidase domain